MSRDGSAPGEPPTPLQRQLTGTGAPARPTPLDALAAARHWFNQGRKLDIQALAAELGVSRVTLHRWVGTREQLLVEVLWVSSERALTRLHEQVRAERLVQPGPHSHTAEVLGRWVREVLAHPGHRQLASEESEMFVRLLTHDASVFQRRLIDLVRELLVEDIAAGRVTIDLEPLELAYTVVRIVESFVHTPAITGCAPDPDGNARVLRALLR
ncbi:MAG TPA: QsdR family transcriptional regulator [Pseudonocardia sp.]